MIRQYYAQRCGGGYNPLRVGTVAVGSIFYLQDEGWFRERYRGKPVCRDPWIVEGFLNRTMGAGRRNAGTGMWENTIMSGGHMAIVRSLRDRRRVQEVRIDILELHNDLDLWVGDNRYPTLPDVARYRGWPTAEVVELPKLNKRQPRRRLAA